MAFDRIGKYEILGKIGQGSMGEVYRAHDPLLNRAVAIKSISSSVDTDSELRKRFLREAQAVAHLNHPNIITVYDLGEEQGRVYMAMELLEGKDLKELIASRGLGGLESKLNILQQICEGLAFAHAKNIIHRDLKPANIHVDPKGRVKILDFGLARMGASEMTRSGMVMGTPHYMSPEQVRGERVDNRSDIFSLGAVSYEVLTEHKPFEGDSMHTIMYKVLQDQPEPIRRWVDVPAELSDIVDRALVKDPAERLQNASEMASALAAVKATLPEEQAGALAPAPGEPRSFPSPVPSQSGSWPGSDRRQSAVRVPPVGRDRRVVGAVALQTGSESGVSAPATLSGRAATDTGSRRGPLHAAGPQPSRLPIYALGGVAGLAVVVAVAFLALRPQGSTPTPSAGPGKGQIGALTEALVANQVELARRKLEDKNYQGAAAQAERALKLDPASAEAQKILEEARGRLGALQGAVGELRAALKGSDAQRVSEAFLKVLAIDPFDPAANDLPASVNPSLRRGADEARKLMGEARKAAEQAKAASLESFSEAASLAGEGEALANKGEFAGAARKLFQARDGFDRSRRTARR